MRGVLILALLIAGFSLPAVAQSLTPMTNSGLTPSDVKGFRLVVGNPYKTRMIFTAIATDATFGKAVQQVVISAPEFALAPGASRPIIVTFKIPAPLKERTIGICISPEDLTGPVLPRVCGRYTGKLISAGG
jgi:hypothetical protein